MVGIVRGISAMVIGFALTASGESRIPNERSRSPYYYRAAAPGRPVTAADGRLAVFPLTRYDLAGAESWTELWLVDADDELHQLTFGRHHNGSPALTPDGARLAFISDRSGSSQVWVMSVDGGEARQLTDFPGGLSGPVWSPDGTTIAVTAEVYPECGGDTECNRTIRRSVDRGPLSVYVAEDLLYRHWNTWREGRYRHILLIDAASGEVLRDLTPGPWDSPILGSTGDAAYAFSPDGSALCYVSNRDEDQASSTNADLWLVALAQDPAHPAARNLTVGNPAWDGHPRFSPDGTRIAYISQEKPGYESALKRLTVLDLASGESVLLTSRESFDDWVDDMQWRRDGESIVFQAQHRGRTPLFEISGAGGDARVLHSHGAILGWSLGAQDSVVYAASGIGRPGEIHRWDGSESRRLTRFNAALEAEVDIRQPDELWIEGPDGRVIHTWIVKPHGFDPDTRYPLILNVHGGPQMQWKDRFRGDWQVYPGKGYVVAFPNPTGSAGFGQDFVDGIACDWSGEVMADLDAVADHLAALPWVDEDRMGAMGWSWGGYAMMWFQGHTTRYKALAAMMGVYDLRSMHGATEELWFVEHDLCGPPWENPEQYRAWSPSSHVEAFSTPTLVITGERDYRVPYTQSLQFFTDLQKRDVPSRLVVFPGAGHWPSWYEMAFYYLQHLDWFQRHLGGGEAEFDLKLFQRNQIFEE
jgi:dipeptidyl aminopeptidase/acylaminoacyl peptidase